MIKLSIGQNNQEVNSTFNGDWFRDSCSSDEWVKDIDFVDDLLKDDEEDKEFNENNQKENSTSNDD